ncbi:MAG: hypothetical protein JEZ00_11170 [Anaerolineaceae bacterium]|nr:hypothetical protein [Anaerolineaceae bacterium]
MMVNTPEMYEILIKGHLSDYLENQFEGLEIRREANGTTILSGLLDQSALHGVLNQISNLGLTLIAVNRVDVEE